MAVDPKQDALELGRRVQERRLALGMTQLELAERAGMERSQVGFIEQGRRDLRLSSIRRIAVGLGCDAGELIAQLG